MPEVLNIFQIEDADVIYARLVNDMPPPPVGGAWDAREGSVLHAVLMPWAIEEVQLQSYLATVGSNQFLWWAVDAALDAKAAEFGVTRLPDEHAQGVVTFTGAEGVVIPAGTIVATSSEVVSEYAGVEYATSFPASISGGFVDVAVQAMEPGASGNVPAGLITVLITPINGVARVENDGAMTGGSDGEDDDALRRRAIMRAALRPQSGNHDSLHAISLDDPEVGEVSSVDQWDKQGPVTTRSGVGSALVVLSGRDTVFVRPDVVDRVQSLLDPSVATLTHFEAPESITQSFTGTGDGWSTEEGQEGAGAWFLDLGASAVGALTHTLPEARNLSFWGNDDDEWWLSVRWVSSDVDFTDIDVILTNNAVGKSVSANAVGSPQSDDGRLVFTTADFSPHGASPPDPAAHLAEVLSSVDEITYEVTVDSSGGQIIIDSLRVRSALGGRGVGEAAIGTQVTVMSATRTYIELSATIELTRAATIDSVQADVERAVSDYLATVPSGGVVRVSAVAQAVGGVVGVNDYSNIEIAGYGGSPAWVNITLRSADRPVLGVVSLFT